MIKLEGYSDMKKFKIPFTIISDESLTGEIFHPGKPDAFNWQAGNSAASTLQGVRSVWSNLAHYVNSAKNFDGYERKLQYKAALCELKILIDVLKPFHNFIMQHKVIDSEGIKREISISSNEKKVLGEKYKLYIKNKNVVESKLLEIRNNIAAHFADPKIKIDKQTSKTIRVGIRKALLWSEIETLWDGLNILDFVDVIMSIQDYLDFASNLDVYEFYRIEPDGVIRTYVPMVGYIDGRGIFNALVGSPELLYCIGLDTDEKLNKFIKNTNQLISG